MHEPSGNRLQPRRAPAIRGRARPARSPGFLQGIFEPFHIGEWQIAAWQPRKRRWLPANSVSVQEQEGILIALGLPELKDVLELDGGGIGGGQDLLERETPRLSRRGNRAPGATRPERTKTSCWRPPVAAGAAQQAAHGPHRSCRRRQVAGNRAPRRSASFSRSLSSYQTRRKSTSHRTRSRAWRPKRIWYQTANSGSASV